MWSAAEGQVEGSWSRKEQGGIVMVDLLVPAAEQTFAPNKPSVPGKASSFVAHDPASHEPSVNVNVWAPGLLSPDISIISGPFETRSKDPSEKILYTIIYIYQYFPTTFVETSIVTRLR